MFFWIALLVLAFIAFRVYKFAITEAEPDINPAGKTILVTGAASGIGYETCLSLLNRGCTVLAVDLKEESIRNAFAKIPQDQQNRLKMFTCDVTSKDDVANLKEQVEKSVDSLYGVINSAGISTPLRNSTDVANLSLTNWEYDVDTWFSPVINVNLIGSMRVTNAFFPKLIESKGCVINISSIAGLLAINLGSSAYSISKHGIAAYTAGLRRECHFLGVNVRVICAHPGFVQTPMVNNAVARKTDFSQSKYGQTFHDRLAPKQEKLREQVAKAQTPDRVGKILADNILCSKPPQPHIVIDFPGMKVLWAALATLPWSIQDMILGLLVLNRAFGPQNFN